MFCSLPQWTGFDEKTLMEFASREVGFVNCESAYVSSPADRGAVRTSRSVHALTRDPSTNWVHAGPPVPLHTTVTSPWHALLRSASPLPDDKRVVLFVEEEGWVQSPAQEAAGLPVALFRTLPLVPVMEPAMMLVLVPNGLSYSPRYAVVSRHGLPPNVQDLDRALFGDPRWDVLCARSRTLWPTATGSIDRLKRSVMGAPTTAWDVLAPVLDALSAPTTAPPLLHHATILYLLRLVCDGPSFATLLAQELYPGRTRKLPYNRVQHSAAAPGTIKAQECIRKLDGLSFELGQWFRDQLAERIPVEEPTPKRGFARRAFKQSSF